MKIVERPVPLNEMLSELKVEFIANTRSNNKDIEILFNPGMGDEQAQIISDPLRLRQILYNLVNNAVKFTTKGYVEFGYRETKVKGKNHLLFFVNDTGVGLSKEKQKRIFEPFSQGSDDTAHNYGGSGLGLAITKNLISLLGGKIWLESDEGKGARFYFTLPLNRSGNQSTTSSTKSTEGHSPLKGKHILLVEDDPVSVEFIENLLEKYQVKLSVARTGPEGIEKALAAPLPQLVLMDIQLPGLNGYEASKKILDQRPGLPIIAQTANVLPSDKEKALASGCVGHITKPLDEGELINVIRHAINKD
jgi:CheY-like chemotaxis protein